MPVCVDRRIAVSASFVDPAFRVEDDVIINGQDPVGLGDLNPFRCLDHVPRFVQAAQLQQLPDGSISTEPGSAPGAVRRPLHGQRALETVSSQIGTVLGVPDRLYLSVVLHGTLEFPFPGPCIAGEQPRVSRNRRIGVLDPRLESISRTGRVSLLQIRVGESSHSPAVSRVDLQRSTILRPCRVHPVESLVYPA